MKFCNIKSKIWKDPLSSVSNFSADKIIRAVIYTLISLDLLISCPLLNKVLLDKIMNCSTKEAALRKEP